MQQKLTILIYTWMLAHSQVGWCFDNDIAINEPNFKAENFLDYKAYEFRKSVQEEWYTVENGWRMAGGSMSTMSITQESRSKTPWWISPFALGIKLLNCPFLVLPPSTNASPISVLQPHWVNEKRTI